MKIKIWDILNTIFCVIPFVVFIWLCAIFSYLCEHIYNLIAKGKWSGMPLI